MRFTESTLSIQIGILRHAIAEDHSPTGSDFDRRLTSVGRAQLDTHLDLLLAWGWAPTAIFHSPYVRTTQTAAAVSARFPGVPCVPAAILAHGDPPDILRFCVGQDAPLLVGHQPTMGDVVAHLLGSPPGTTPLERAGFALLDVNRLPTTRPARPLPFAPPLGA